MNRSAWVHPDGWISTISEQTERIVPVDEFVDPATHYGDFATGEILEREEMPFVVDGTTVTGIPCLCFVDVSGPLELKDRQTDGGQLHLSFDLPGAYTLSLTPSVPRWLPAVIEIEVPE